MHVCHICMYVCIHAYICVNTYAELSMFVFFSYRKNTLRAAVVGVVLYNVPVISDVLTFHYCIYVSFIVGPSLFYMHAIIFAHVYE